MGSLFTLLFSKIAAVVQWFADLAVAVFVAGWDFITDGFAWAFEQILKVAVSALTVIDFSALANYTAGATLPASILNILALLGVGTAIAIIVAAITIRLGLQLIPFVRLGS